MSEGKSTENEWLKYPDEKPTSSKFGAKVFYYAQLKDEWFSGSAYKCWYTHDGIWLCDIFQSSVEVKLFRPCARNAKADIMLKDEVQQ